jgi:hypothetical protein
LGGSGTFKITTSISGGFDSAISLSATGYPIGVTVTFSFRPHFTPSTISLPLIHIYLVDIIDIISFPLLHIYLVDRTDASRQ